MKKKLLFIVLSVIFVIAALFSCTSNNFKSDLIDKVEMVVKSEVAADTYKVVVADKNGQKLVEKTLPAAEKIVLEKVSLKPGEYNVKIEAYKNKELVGEAAGTMALPTPLAGPFFITGFDITLDAVFLSRAENFQVKKVANSYIATFKNNGYDKYTLYAKVGDAWVKLDEGTPTSDPYTITISIGPGRKIQVGNYKVPENEIKLFGLNVKRSNKESGIAAVPLLYACEPTGGEVRSSAAATGNFLFICSNDGYLYAYEIGESTMVYLDARLVVEPSTSYKLNTMSPTLDGIDATKTAVYVAGGQQVYRFVFNASTKRFVDEYKSSSPFGGGIQTSPLVIDDYVIVGEVKDTNSAIHVLYKDDLIHAISYPTLNGLGIASSPVASGTYVFVPTAKKVQKENGYDIISQLFVLNTDGFSFKYINLGYSYYRGESGSDVPIVSSAAIHGNILYLGTRNGEIIKVDFSNGMTSPSTNSKHLTLGRIDASPIVDSDGNIYIGTDGGYVVKLDSSLNIIWKFYTGNDIRGNDRDAVRSTPLLANDGTLYVGTYEGYLYALDKVDGTVKWRYQTGDRIWSSPTLIRGKLIFGSHDKNVYMLKASGELAPGWTKWRKDLENTARK